MSLSETSLEQALLEIQGVVKDGKAISIRPTKLLMYPYPDETVEEFKQRWLAAREMVSRLEKEK
jgi:hypothetical protein